MRCILSTGTVHFKFVHSHGQEPNSVANRNLYQQKRFTACSRKTREVTNIMI